VSGVALCAFNASFAEYAAALIHSILSNSPGWQVHAFATNVSPVRLAGYPFNHPQVVLYPEIRRFPDSQAERFYMNSRRFVRYQALLDHPGWDTAVMLDADQLVLRPLDPLRDSMLAGNHDVGLFVNPKGDREHRVSACTAACRNTPSALKFWKLYEQTLNPTGFWFNDQVTMLAVWEQMGTALKVLPLPGGQYRNFKDTPGTVVLVTNYPNKLRGNTAYTTAFVAAKQAVEIRRLRDPVLPEAVDLVVPLGGGAAPQQDLDLRLSLRAWQSNAPWLHHIWIVGETPVWLTTGVGVTVIPFKDQKRHKDRNLIDKTLEACRHPRVSRQFVYSADDQFPCRPIRFGDIHPYWQAEGRMAVTEKSTVWQRRKAAMLDWLVDHNKSAHHYEGHLPIPVDRDEFLTIMPGLPYQKDDLLIKSTYLNLSIRWASCRAAQGKVKLSVEGETTIKSLDKALRKPYVKFMGHSAVGFTPVVQQWLLAQYPQRAPWENSDLVLPGQVTC